MQKLSITHAIVAALLVLAGMLAAKPSQDNPMAPYIPKNMKPYFLVLLVSGDKSLDSASKEEHAAAVMGHLAFLRTQVEAGKIVLVGPALDDGNIRGMAIFQVGSAAEAAQLEQADPMVEGGYARSEVHPVMLEDLSGVKFDYPRKAN